MKKALLLVCCLIGAAIFLSANKSNTPQSEMNLEGVWEMEHQYLFENNQVSDTLYNLSGYRQVKIYTKGKVMWTRFNPADSNEWFGYGHYEIVDGYLEEHLEYASNTMMKIIDTVQVFRFELELSKDRYSQITLDNKGNRYNSENYIRLE
jgi:hypothetical protein